MPLLRPTYVFHRASAITPQFLQAQGIKGLILDVDNTLTAHGSQELPCDIARWLEEMRAAGIKMTIASNNFKKRVEPFARKLALPFASFCCKPSPLGLARACRTMGVHRSEAALVGDQIFTDAMGANLYGIPVLLVEPMQDDQTWSIRLKRKLEGPVLKRYYRKGGKLWP